MQKQNALKLVLIHLKKIDKESLEKSPENPREALKELLLADHNCSHVQRVKANYIEALII